MMKSRQQGIDNNNSAACMDVRLTVRAMRRCMKPRSRRLRPRKHLQGSGKVAYQGMRRRATRGIQRGARAHWRRSPRLQSATAIAWPLAGPTASSTANPRGSSGRRASSLSSSRARRCPACSRASRGPSQRGCRLARPDPGARALPAPVAHPHERHQNFGLAVTPPCSSPPTPRRCGAHGKEGALRLLFLVTRSRGPAR